MSHFTRLKTQIVEKEYLLKALKDLGYQAEEGELYVHAVGQSKQQVEIKVHLGLLGREVGFRKSGDTYDIIADWWGLRGNTRQEFQDKLAQRYAYHAAIARLQEQGFALVTDETQENGQVHLTLRRVA
jgi:hypothetical protein